MAMSRPLRIDFVSDIMCPWCVVGLKSLEAALERTKGTVTAEIHFQPFELNPGMVAEGENTAEHIARKYGAAPPEQMAASRNALKAAAAAHGFTINTGPESRVWNSFDAHRLLHWAGTIGAAEQRALKLALFEAHFTRGEVMNDPETLANTATTAGLDGTTAREILAGDRYAEDVRATEAQWPQVNISAVPAIIFDRQYLVVGGQPVETFEQVIREIAAKPV